jgi:hypothetical protein
MRLVTLTHANLNEAITADIDVVTMWWHSPGQKCSIVMTNGGGAVPVLETCEAIRVLKEGSSNVGTDEKRPDDQNRKRVRRPKQQGR